MADVTVANTAPGIAGKTLACHDADGVTTGLWTLASPLALRGGVPANQTWRLGVSGAGNLSILADGTGQGLAALSTAGSALFTGDLSEKNRPVPLGHWTDVLYDPANFSATSGSWTVTAPGVVSYRYTLVGKTMVLGFFLSDTTVSASTIELRLRIPGGYQAAATYITPALTLSDIGADFTPGYLAITSALDYVGLRRHATSSIPWSAGPHTTVSGSIVIALA